MPALLPPVPVQAAAPARDTLAPADSLRVFLVTFGPGELVWERFGHNAIWIHDPAAGTDLAYNWGMFSFDQQGFLARLLRGTMLYWMAPFPIDAMINAYAAADRSVWVQELAIVPARRSELQAALADNARPENAYYRYDYYRDNCSTRVRDALDRVVDGRIRAALAGAPSGTTYRSHTRRLLQDMPAMYTGIQLVLSPRADREIDRWEEAFLPVRLMQALREVRVPDGAGGERPLVIGEREAFRAVGPAEPETVPNRLPWFLAAGVGFAVVLGLLVDPAGRGRAWARVPLVLLTAGWSLAAGMAGLVLVGAWMFTDHVFWYPNENLLQTNPFALALAALALPLLVRRAPSAAAVRVGVGIAALSLLGLALKALPGFDQMSWEILAFTVPVNVGVAAALIRLRRSGEATARA